MKIIGRARRAIPLAIKLEECLSCQTIGSHAIARRVRWFEILSLQLVRLGSDHVLICGNCGSKTPISKDVAKTGLETRKMEIDRERPILSAELLRRAGPRRGEWSASPSWSVFEEDPALVRATYDRRLREVVRIPGPNRQAVYAKAWPVLALLVAGAVAIPGGSFALQVAGVGMTEPSPSLSATSGQAVPTSSPSPRPTPRPPDRPSSAYFAWWVQAYKDAIEPCYAGGSCDLGRKISYTDGTSGLLGEEAVSLAALYRDHDTIQVGSVSDCRQEHGSMFALLASIASEVSVIEALKPGESMPVTWRPALGVSFEPCTLPYLAEKAAELRSLLEDARGELSKAKKFIKGKNWSGAEAVSGRLTELALKIARASASDFPEGGEGAWAPIRTIGWDLLRVSGFLHIKRLAAAASTTKLIDGSIAAIDRVKLGGS